MCWLWLLNKHFVPVDQWERECPLVVYEARIGNVEALCLALAWRKGGTQGSYRSHIEKGGPLQSAVAWDTKGEEVFNHHFFPET